MSEVDYNECMSCGEMLVLTPCKECEKWLCSRCIFDHQCKWIWIKK